MLSFYFGRTFTLHLYPGHEHFSHMYLRTRTKSQVHFFQPRNIKVNQMNLIHSKAEAVNKLIHLFKSN